MEDDSTSQKDGPPGAPDAPPFVHDKDGLLRKSMSIASCSMSVVETAGYQVSLTLNVTLRQLHLALFVCKLKPADNSTHQLLCCIASLCTILVIQ